MEGAEDCVSTEPKLKPVRAALAGAAAVPASKAGVDAAGAPNARGEDAALAPMPKERGADAGVAAAVEGRGVLMARAKEAGAAAEAVLAGVVDGMPGNCKAAGEAGAADPTPKGSPVLGAPAWSMSNLTRRSMNPAASQLLRLIAGRVAALR